MFRKYCLISSLLIILVFFGVTQKVHAQDLPIGSWKIHVPLKGVFDVIATNDYVYGMGNNGILKYDKESGELIDITSIQGLKGVDISAMAFSEEYQLLLVAYDDGALNIIDGNEVFLFEDIIRSSIIGSKSINKIDINGQIAYLSCDFGIVSFNLKRMEFGDTYIIGPNASTLQINDVQVLDDKIYAATAKGVFSAFLEGFNLIDFNSWTKESSLSSENYSHIVAYDSGLVALRNAPDNENDTLFRYIDGQWSELRPGVYFAVNNVSVSNKNMFVTYTDAVHEFVPDLWVLFHTNLVNGFSPRAAFMENDKLIWFADQYKGLIKKKDNQPKQIESFETIHFRDVFNLYYHDGSIYSTTGGYNGAMNSVFRNKGYSSYDGLEWANHPFSPKDTLYDAISLVVDPNDATVSYISLWNQGLAKFKNNELVEVYDQTNSSLQYFFEPLKWTRVGGLAFDASGNLWMTNSQAEDMLSVKYADDTWQSFSLKPVTQGEKCDKLLVHSSGQKWVQVYRQGIAILDDGNTPKNTSDDRKKFLSTGEGNGNLPASDVKCFVEDLDGEVWVGTSQGLGVVYNPELMFDIEGIESQPILVETDGVVNELFQNEAINTIAVDGANRKWIGTFSSGVFLVSENGLDEIAHFTTDNSPLLSNNITSIAVNDENGEVFINTDKGLLSYRSTATESVESFGEVYVYPNPIRPGYDGPIAIKGLVGDTQFKITDISGNLVFQGSSLGGQAIWDGKNHDGRPVQTGVYLFFITNYDGSETAVTKIAVVR